MKENQVMGDIRIITIENNKIRIQLNTKDDVEVILPVSNSNKK